MTIRLNEFASDTYSQNGEDGMVVELLRRLGIEDGTCVEVGAHDGFTFSNTARLWHDHGWRAALVEPDPRRVRLLRQRVEGHDCVVIPTGVAPTGDERLESLLDSAAFPRSVDVLSVDIDGDDLAIVRTLGSVRARILLCEYNPTIPYDLLVHGEPGSPTGCSLGALAAVAAEGGYRLVGVTRTNGIFVREDHADLVADLEQDLAVLVDRSCYTYVVTDYRGRASLVGPLPFRFRPGRPRFTGAEPRNEVVVRWTAYGLMDATRWKVENLARAIARMGPRELLAVSGRKLRAIVR